MMITGDWHCAYVLLYGPRILEIDENEDSEVEKPSEEKSNGSKTASNDTAMETS